MKFSKALNKERRKEESNLFYEISQCCSKPELSKLNKKKLMKLQTQLDNIYLKRAQGAFVRSRAK